MLKNGEKCWKLWKMVKNVQKTNRSQSCECFIRIHTMKLSDRSYWTDTENLFEPACFKMSHTTQKSVKRTDMELKTQLPHRHVQTWVELRHERWWAIPSRVSFVVFSWYFSWQVSLLLQASSLCLLGCGLAGRFHHIFLRRWPPSQLLVKSERRKRTDVKCKSRGWMKISLLMSAMISGGSPSWPECSSFFIFIFSKVFVIVQVVHST